MFCNWNRISMPLWFVCFIMVSSATGQSATTTTNAAVPTLVNYSGTLTGVDEKPLTTLTGVTFYLYENSQGGAPLWMEVQNVQPNKAGHYSVTLGSTTSQGLPVSTLRLGGGPLAGGPGARTGRATARHVAGCAVCLESRRCGNHWRTATVGLYAGGTGVLRVG